MSKQTNNVGLRLYGFRVILTVEGVMLRLEQRGVRVVETLEHMDGRVGWYCHQSRTIGLHPDLLERQKLPVLLHEAIHHARQDEGHQSEAVERRINEQVASLLIDPVDYAWAEGQVGHHTGGLAALLDVPMWVVEAYRRTLARAA